MLDMTKYCEGKVVVEYYLNDFFIPTVDILIINETDDWECSNTLDEFYTRIKDYTINSKSVEKYLKFVLYFQLDYTYRTTINKMTFQEHSMTNNKAS